MSNDISKMECSDIVTEVSVFQNGSKPKFECWVCQRIFARKASLDIHMRIHTGDKPYKCDMCAFSGRDPTLLYRHKLAKHPTVLLKFECDECGQEFTTKRLLRLHKRQHMGNHECDTCGRVYVRKKDMTQHKKYKHPEQFEKPFQCDTCLRSFTYNHLLTAHQQRYRGTCCSYEVIAEGTTLRCDLCKKRFAEIDTYKRHQQTHLKKHWICSTCGTPCNSSHNLKVHEAKHKKVVVPRRFECDVCKMTFAKNLTLKLHKNKMHGILKMCKCTICNAEFPNRLELNHHRKMHMGEKCYECDVCQSKFSKKSSVITHKRKKHTGEKPFLCEICNKTFHATSSLRVHFTKGSCKGKISGSYQPLEIDEEQTECPICHVDFPTPFSLIEHLSIHPTPKVFKSNIAYKAFVCDFCGRCFPTEFHKSQHKCDIEDSSSPFFGTLNNVSSADENSTSLQSGILLQLKKPDSDMVLSSMSSALYDLECSEDYGCDIGTDRDIFDRSDGIVPGAEAYNFSEEQENKPEQFICAFCNREFINDTYLQNHMKYSPQCKLTDI